MYYAWPTAASFSNGDTPTARAQSTSALVKKVAAEGHKRAFVALLLDGAWVDLTTYGPGNEDGREVSEERTARYIRARSRALEATGADEVNQSTPMPSKGYEAEQHAASVSNTDGPALESNYQPALSQQPQREQVNLAINPAQVKAIYEFLAMGEAQREAAMNALSALSMSADAFKSAVAIMLEPDVDLIVSISEAEQQ